MYDPITSEYDMRRVCIQINLTPYSVLLSGRNYVVAINNFCKTKIEYKVLFIYNNRK